MNFGAAVTLWRGQLFGYHLRYLPRPAERDLLMTRLREAVPMKMWDAGVKRWWVPAIYSHIFENVAVERGALFQEDLALLHTWRNAPVTIADDLKRLGLQPEAPLRLVKLAHDYWVATLNSIPSATLELEEIRSAYGRIEAHFAARP